MAAGGVNVKDYMFVDLNHVNAVTSNWMQRTDKNFSAQRLNLDLNRRLEDVKKNNAQSYIGSVLIILVTLAAFISLTWFEMKTRYAFEISVYEKVMARGPSPLSEFNVGINCALWSLKYHQFFKLANGLFFCQHIERQSAWFLLLMLQEFPQMEAIHWSGSAEQLNARRLAHFLRSFNSWNHRSNPFRFLFKSEAEFELSVAVREVKKKGLTGSVLESLFAGGFCRVAIDHASMNTNAKELAKKMLARVVVFKRTCEAEKHMRRVKAGMDGANAAGTTVTTGIMMYGAYAGYTGAVAANSGVAATLGATAHGAFLGGAAAVKTALAGGAAAAAGGTAATTATATAGAAAGCAGPWFPICFAIALAVIMAVVGAITAGVYASQGSGGECTGGDYYIVEEDDDGNEILERVENPP